MTNTLHRRAPLAAAAAAAVALTAGAALAGCGQAVANGAAPAARSSQSPGGHSAGSAGGQTDGHGSPGGSAGQSGGHPAAGRTVCAEQAAVTAVRVVRTPPISQVGGTKPAGRKLPAITISDPSRARGLARTVCALPRMPHGTFNCPADFGGGYQLEFMAGAQRLAVVTVRASGCEDVIGASPGVPRWVMRTAGFWPAFAKLTGIRAPAHLG